MTRQWWPCVCTDDTEHNRNVADNSTIQNVTTTKYNDRPDRSLAVTDCQLPTMQPSPAGDQKCWPKDKPHLSPLSADTTSKLYVLRHDGHPLGVDGTQVGVLKQADEVGLTGFLQTQPPNANIAGTGAPTPQETFNSRHGTAQ